MKQTALSLPASLITLKPLKRILALSALFFGASATQVMADNEIRIGYVSPKSGPFAPFAEADDFLLEKIETSLANGLDIGGEHYTVKIIPRDDQSRPDRASNQAADLINDEEVDLILSQVSIGPSTPQQAEFNGVPSISTMGPWEAWMFPMGGKPGTGFNYAYHFFWGIQDIADVYVSMWDSIKTNKKVGMVWSNDLPGLVMGDMKTGMPATFKKAGYDLIQVGAFSVGADDFTAHIQEFKKQNVEIVTGLFNPPEWATFVAQANQMGFYPKIMTPAKALLFPAGVEVLGKSANGMSTEIWWTPAYPFKSSIDGTTSKELAAEYEKETGKKWTQPLGVAYALFEAGIKALELSGDPKDPDAVAKAIGKMKVDTIIGQLDFGHGPAKNVSSIRVVGGQWLTDKEGKADIYITNNKTAPEVPVQKTFSAITQ